VFGYGKNNPHIWRFLELARDLCPNSLSDWLLVDEIAKLKWISARLRRAEAGLFDHSLMNAEFAEENIGLAAGLRNNIDIVERSSKLIMDYDKIAMC
jgi:hypothetical protein